jgi:hypothetical protein
MLYAMDESYNIDKVQQYQQNLVHPHDISIDTDDPTRNIFR